MGYQKTELPALSRKAFHALFIVKRLLDKRWQLSILNFRTPSYARANFRNYRQSAPTARTLDIAQLFSKLLSNQQALP